MSSVEKRFYGVVSGILGTMRMTGQMFSMGMTMLIFAVLIGRVQITPEYYPFFLKSVKVAFAFLQLFALGAYLRRLQEVKFDRKHPQFRDGK
jgi:hypothetical protein